MIELLKKATRLKQITRTVSEVYLSSFGQRRLPYSIFWYVSWQCNSRCLHCKFGLSPNESSGPPDELPLSRIKEVISEARSFGAAHIAFAGGEPFVNPDFLKIVEHCKKEGFVVGVSTNGFRLADSNFAREVLERGVDRLDLSLDAPDELHDELRGVPGAFNLVDGALDNLLTLKPHYNCYVGINTVVSGFNFRRLEEIFKYARRKGIDGVGLQPFHHTQARRGDLVSRFLLTADQAQELKHILKNIISQQRPLLKNSPFFVKNIANFYEDQQMPGLRCYGGLQEIHIFPEGNIGVCCFNRGQLSLREHGLREIIQSDDFAQVIRRAQTKDCPGCWSPPVHEYNILFRPQELFSGLSLLRTFLRWTKD